LIARQSKKGIKADVRGREKKAFMSLSFYKESEKEAKKLVYELRKPN
jgi:hypothetical protein